VANLSWTNVACANGLFVATSSDGRVMTSEDGISWTLNPANAGIGFTSVTYGNNRFVGVEFGQRVAVSGPLAATSVTVVSDTEITAVTPAGLAGAANVAVTAPTGTSPDNTLFTFGTPGTPSISAITPAGGPIAGGTAIDIVGTGFSGATHVTFNGAPATDVTAISDRWISAVTPATTAGQFGAVVTTPAGTGSGGSFRFFAVPMVTAISPASGPLSGGTAVTITGTFFDGMTGVTIGGVAALSPTLISDTTITAITPPGVAGTASVVVTTPGGPSAANSL
jgi:hypothetical protein